MNQEPYRIYTSLTDVIHVIYFRRSSYSVIEIVRIPRGQGPSSAV